MLIEVKIGALMMDPNNNAPIVVLKGVESDDVLPIWVGPFEANAIALEIEKISPQRPMTHDLLRNFIVESDFSVNKIIISDLKDNTFYAKIELADKSQEVIFFDSRPSDAIALALRTDCPIFVDQSVFDVSNSNKAEIEDVEENIDKLEMPPSTDEWDDIIY